MTLILKITSPGPRLPLTKLPQLPLGLDIWEVKSDHAVVRASEAQADRLKRMGYGVEQLRLTEDYIAAFHTGDVAAGYHSVATLEQDLRALATDHPDIAELRPRRHLRADASVPALRSPGRRRYHGLDLRHVRYSLVHDRVAPRLASRRRIYPSREPDPAHVGRKPACSAGVHPKATLEPAQLTEPET